ncbi:MAG: dockerin type I domain-containing protein, partial [Patescibacteria group bacterium]
TSKTYINYNASGSTSGVNGTIGSWILGRRTSGVSYLDVDVNSDGLVSPTDVTNIKQIYRNVSSDSTFVIQRDINIDNLINVQDIARVGFQFGTRG